MRDEFERERPRVDADCDPDLANDVALDRGRRGLVVEGAGRSSGTSLFPGNFDRILFDLRIDIAWLFREPLLALAARDILGILLIF